ncbi:MAG: HlyC/CorC family transporter [Anaerolineaceae bacterium]|nr:HlyC/CorC family transporter [Anaerolineaceae bacterium]
MKEPDSQTLFLLLIFFLVLDLLFVAVRSSFVHARVPQLVGSREIKVSALDRTLRLLERPYLPASLRVGVVLMHFSIAVTVWMVFRAYSVLPGHPFLLLVLVLLLALVLLLLEFILEGIVLRKPETWALNLTPVCEVLDTLFRPVSWLLMAVIGKPASLQRNLGSVTEDELKVWVQVGQPEGTLEKGERKMIYSIFHFSDTLCREIMVPRIDVVALDSETPVQEAAQTFIHSGHSRVPVYEENIDNVIGLLYAKDLLKFNVDGEKPQAIRQLLRPVFFVPEAKKVDELLREMQERGVHMVVAVDEYGGIAGLLTLEDIVEEIIGEIRDEYDQSEENLYQQVSPKEFLFSGRIDLDDFNEIIGTRLTKDVADTLGGFIYGQIGRVPVGGEHVQVENWELTVEQVIGRRIRLVRARRQDENEELEGINGELD